MNRNFDYLLAEANAAIRNADHRFRGRGETGAALYFVKRARNFLSLARMELAREVVQEIDSGHGIATPAQWALATKILKPLRLVRTKGGK